MTQNLPDGFLRRMHTLLGGDFDILFEGYDRSLRRGIRVNTLKYTARDLAAWFPLPLSPVPFARDGFAFEGAFRAGADPLHHAGAYYMQEASAMSAVTVLSPLPGERILDLCAAPGGKSTQIAACLQGQGLLWSNEYGRSRAQILLQNLERCGVANAVVSSADAGTIGGGLPRFFDGVLVDAPCSGEGMFRKEPEALAQWSEDNIRLCAARQREILHAAAETVRPGGRLIYSTCTFAPEENECMAAWFVRTHPDFCLEETGAGFGMPGLPWERVAPFAPETDGAGVPLERCRRIFPAHGGEGPFVAKFRRKEAGAYSLPRPYLYAKPDTNSIAAAELYKECFFSTPTGAFVCFGDQVRLLPEGLPELKGLGVLQAGAAAAIVCKNRVEPCHGLFMAMKPADCRRCICLEPADPRLTAFLRGEEIEAPGEPGWTAVAADGVVTGFGKRTGGRLKNRYPKGLRLRT